jgi:hypothetical protein
MPGCIITGGLRSLQKCRPSKRLFINSGTATIGLQKMWPNAEEFDYSEVRALWKFKGTHPEVMQNLIKEKNWTFDHDISRNSFSIKDNMKRIAAKTLGYIPGEYKNYIEI